MQHAFKKGAAAAGGEGFIYLSSRLIDKVLYIQIEDNGSGISIEQVNQLNQTMEFDFLEIGEHIGLTNVNQRLKLVFGEQYGLEISSRLDKGTAVRLKIPEIRSEDMAG